MLHTLLGYPIGLHTLIANVSLLYQLLYEMFVSVRIQLLGQSQNKNQRSSSFIHG